jgi:hypothetical protein
MTDLVTALVVVYLAGVAIGLLVVDEPFPGRVIVAASWPLGPLAFVAVVTILLLTLPVALPRVAAALACVVALSWLLLRAAS